MVTDKLKSSHSSILNQTMHLVLVNENILELTLVETTIRYLRFLTQLTRRRKVSREPMHTKELYQSVSA